MSKNFKKGLTLLFIMLVTVTSVLGMGSNLIAAQTIDGTIYSGNTYNLQFKINSLWESGFEGQFILINNSDKPLENWKVQLKFNHEITSIWDGEIESREGNIYVIKYPNWNQTIPAGGKAIIGVIGKCNGAVAAPFDYKLIKGSKEASKESYSITYHTTSDWKDGFNGEISVTNHTQKAIENWQLEFDFEKNIMQLWNAKLVEKNGDHYIVKHDGWNSIIKAGETVTFGFQGKAGNVTMEPVRYKLTESKSADDTCKGESEYKITALAEDSIDSWFNTILLKINVNSINNKK